MISILSLEQHYNDDSTILIGFELQHYIHVLYVRCDVRDFVYYERRWLC